MQQELADAQERTQKLEALVARKEAFYQRLVQMLIDIECEENEIAILEKGVRSHYTSARRSAVPQVPQ